MRERASEREQQTVVVVARNQKEKKKKDATLTGLPVMQAGRAERYGAIDWVAATFTGVVPAVDQKVMFALIFCRSMFSYPFFIETHTHNTPRELNIMKMVASNVID